MHHETTENFFREIVAVGELYLQVRPGVYAVRLLRGAGAGAHSAAVHHDHEDRHLELRLHWRAVARLDTTRLHLPGDQLSLRGGHLHPSELLRGHRRRQQPGHTDQGIQFP